MCVYPYIINDPLIFLGMADLTQEMRNLVAIGIHFKQSMFT